MQDDDGYVNKIKESETLSKTTIKSEYERAEHKSMKRKHDERDEESAHKHKKSKRSHHNEKTHSSKHGKHSSSSKSDKKHDHNKKSSSSKDSKHKNENVLNDSNHIKTQKSESKDRSQKFETIDQTKSKEREPSISEVKQPNLVQKEKGGKELETKTEKTKHKNKDKKDKEKSSKSSKSHKKDKATTSSSSSSKLGLNHFTDGIGSGSGASFAEALGMLEPCSSKTVIKYKKVSSPQEDKKSTSSSNKLDKINDKSTVSFYKLPFSFHRITSILGTSDTSTIATTKGFGASRIEIRQFIAADYTELSTFKRAIRYV